MAKKFLAADEHRPFARPTWPVKNGMPAGQANSAAPAMFTVADKMSIPREAIAVFSPAGRGAENLWQ